ncbi:EAL domain-containing protein [Halopseudomonas pelagia]|nr:EAL domain-containing protein [Halopseudomonas pelagia]|tara:strand:+ start:194119 stop:196944 length:2826 start_codon:yes stop_codon:yes gene_type:complete
MLYEYSRLPQWLIMLSALVISSLVWDITPRSTLLSWLGVVAVLILLRSLLVRHYRQAAPLSRLRLRWTLLFYLGNLASGFCLAWVQLSLVPLDNFTIQAPAYGLSTGVGLCVSIIYASRFMAFATFALPAWIPPILYLLTQSDPTSIYWGMMGVTLFGCLLLGAAFINRSGSMAMRANARSEALVAGLDDSRQQAEALNQQLTREIQQRRQAEQRLRESHTELEQRVSQRTVELQQAGEALQASEAQLSLALDASQLGLWDWDLTTDRVYHSHVHEIFGLEEDAVTSMLDHLKPRLHPDDAPLVRDTLLKHMKKQIPSYRIEYRVKHADGSWIWVEDSGRAVARDEQGRVLRMIGTRRDISARKQQHEQAQLASTVFQATAEGIFILDPDLNILSVNHAFSVITGYALEEAVGHPIYDPVVQSKNQQSLEDLKNSLQTTDRWEGERIGQRRSGELYPQWMQLAVVRDSSGTITHYVGFFADLSVHRQTEEQLHYLTTHDALTQLANRNMFTQQLQEATSRARQNGSTLALMHVDLDRFKYINDTLGHKVADELLQQVAMRLRDLTPESDSLARLSADEFVIIIDQGCQREQLEHRANQVLEVLRQPITIAEHELIVTASVGLSQFPTNARDNLLLITQANQAMQHAKHLGGNSFQFFTDNLQAYSLDRLQLENQLRKALEEDQLVVHYQPKLHLATDQIRGAEALVRWQHPERGLIMPGHFIEIAEETGMIIALGDAVLIKACQQAALWYHEGPKPITVAVNLSVQQLRQNHFAARVAQILEAADLPAKMLELELTESMLLEHVDAVAENIAALQKMGIKLAIDDFGTGYSSLAYLKRFPITTLKIDRAFISELDERSEQDEHSEDNTSHDAAIVRAIIAMAHSLSLNVVAEGVEEAGQLSFLKQHGCDEVQGYLISRPLTGAGLTGLLLENSETQPTPQV